MLLGRCQRFFTLYQKKKGAERPLILCRFLRLHTPLTVFTNGTVRLSIQCIVPSLQAGLFYGHSLMKITLNQYEIEDALEAFITRYNLSICEMDITAGRGSNGITADLEVQPLDMPKPVKDEEEETVPAPTPKAKPTTPRTTLTDLADALTEPEENTPEDTTKPLGKTLFGA